MNTDNQITDNLKIISLPINNVRIDGNTQYRIVIDQATVYNYLNAIKQGDEFPLIDVVYDGTDYWLTDGFHRYHAFKLLGMIKIQVNCKNGCLRDAQIEALKANCQHGKPLTNDDKRNKVQMALKIDGFSGKSDRELAKICNVSTPLVSSVRDPKIKTRQAENVKKHFEKKISTSENCNLITPPKANPYVGIGPDEDEIRASELALEADQEAFYKILESDEALATAYDEIKRLNHLNSQLEIQVRGLMNQSNQQIKMIKQLQKENARLKTIKQAAPHNSGLSTLEEFRGH
jgi:hypothetical protein